MTQIKETKRISTKLGYEIVFNWEEIRKAIQEIGLEKYTNCLFLYL